MLAERTERLALRGRFRLVLKPGVETIILMLVLTARLPAAEPGRNVERAFIWDEANAVMAAARSPEDFYRAATTYQELLRRGVRNGPLLYNYGTALLKSERYQPARQALLAAERYTGKSEDIEHNLYLAIVAGDEGTQRSLPWYRVFLFWHFGLPGAIRLALAAAGFSLLWLALALKLLNWTALARSTLGLSLVIMLLFGSSSAASLLAESRSGLLPVDQAETANRLPTP